MVFKRQSGIGLVLLLLLSCGQPVPEPKVLSPPVAREESTRLWEETLSPAGRPEIFILSFHDTVSEDTKDVFVEGTLANRGSQATQGIRVSVEGLDANGRVMARAEAYPVPQAVAPGGNATFVVKLPNDPAIRHFRVEAIAR